jgi:tetratricopeptide (TPR) repeat protein
MEGKMTGTPGLLDGSPEQAPNPPPAGSRMMTFEEAEVFLLTRLRETVFDLANLYNRNRQPQHAIRHIQQLMTMTHDPGEKAHCCLNIGQLMEQLDNYEGAVEYYLQAYSLEPVNPVDWYLIHNNLGYSLNKLSRYSEAERYCRTAIQINPERYNAYKNLGIALEGQEKWLEAASNYILSTRAEPSDPRALQHLENLLENHPDLIRDNPSLSTEVDDCRKANQPTI